MSVIYKILLKQKSGLLSKLQSDTIFGHFCWRLKEKFGEDVLSEFLSLYSSGNPVFSISDGMIEKDGITYINKPKMQIPFIYEKKNKKDRIKDAIVYKEFKSRNFITIDQLNLFLNNQIDDYNKSFESIKETPIMFSEVRVNVQIDRQTSASAEGRLFNLNPLFNQVDSLISIFIKVIDQDTFLKYQVLDIMRFLFETGYGKKKSSGFGEFEVCSIDNFIGIKEPNETNGFVIFSNYLPSEEDGVSNAYYDLNLKYGKLGEGYSNKQNPFKKPILFLTAGSCFLTEKNNEFYGRCTEKSEIMDTFPNVIQNGIAFSLRFKTGL